MALRECYVNSVKESQQLDLTNKDVSRSLSMKNRRAAGNWKQLIKAIETQRTEKSAEINHNRNKLLGKRDEIRTRTVSLLSNKSLSFQEEKPALLKVYDNLMNSIEKEKRKKSSNVNDSITRHTLSSEKKKVLRKNVSLSLNELHTCGAKPSIKSKEHMVRSSNLDISTNDNGIKYTRPQSAFDYTEEEYEISRRLYCSPVALPKIYLQTSHKPRFRSFDKDDEEYRKKISGDEESWKDIHQCRYLRVQKRSHTMHDLRRNIVKSTI